MPLSHSAMWAAVNGRKMDDTIVKRNVGDMTVSRVSLERNRKEREDRELV